jgi:hypothetical protein
MAHPVYPLLETAYDEKHRVHLIVVEGMVGTFASFEFTFSSVGPGFVLTDMLYVFCRIWSHFGLVLTHLCSGTRGTHRSFGARVYYL